MLFIVICFYKVSSFSRFLLRYSQISAFKTKSKLMNKTFKGVQIDDLTITF